MRLSSQFDKHSLPVYVFINVSPYINAKAWDFEILLDPNGDFKRAMGVNNVPHTFLVDSDGNIVYSHNNYAPGDEDELYEQVLKLGSK